MFASSISLLAVSLVSQAAAYLDASGRVDVAVSLQQECSPQYCSPTPYCAVPSFGFANPDNLNKELSSCLDDSKCFVIDKVKRRCLRDFCRKYCCLLGEMGRGEHSNPEGPYTVFGNMLVFLENIPVQGIKNFFTCVSPSLTETKNIQNIIENTIDYSNFDIFVNLFYVADSARGLGHFIFDRDYVNWFINRFFFFMASRFLKNTSYVTGVCVGGPGVPTTGGCCSEKRFNEVNYLCLPEPWEGFVYSDSALFNIFSKITTDTVIRLAVQRFIGVLISQLRLTHFIPGTPSKPVSRDDHYTTLTLYLDLTRRSLEATSKLAQLNHDIKYAYLAPLYYSSFAVIPVVYQPAAVTPVNRGLYIVIPSTQVDVSRIVDFS